MEIDPTAAAGFSAAADVYERARPGYSPEAVTWLVERVGIRTGRDILELAAGTGKLTRQLLPHRARLISLEPVAEMRAQLAAAVPDVEAIEGMAEAIPLAKESVDAVVCAQAFHWFRPQEALSEIHRVLRRGGGLALIWNSRDSSDPVQAKLEALLDPHRPDYPGGSGRWQRELEASSLFGPVERREWPFEQHLTREGLVERFASVSFVAVLPSASREALLDEVRALSEGIDEPIRLPHATEVFACDRL